LDLARSTGLKWAAHRAPRSDFTALAMNAADFVANDGERQPIV
jgi:hypothetical protein